MIQSEGKRKVVFELRCSPLICLSISPSYKLFFFSFFRAAPIAYRSSQARGPIGATAAVLHHSPSHSGSKSCLRPTPQLMGNTRAWTHCARPGNEPTSSWIPVRFISTAPRWELPNTHFLSTYPRHCIKSQQHQLSV